jgi:hypothetical protein
LIKRTLIIYFLSVFIAELNAQQSRVIQFSGIIYAKTENPTPLPHVGIGILRTRHGTYSDLNGFFSMAAETGDTIICNYLGYKSKKLVIPGQLNEDRYFQTIYLEQDTFLLESAVVYSIPSREHFRMEFLEMNVDDKMKEIAQQNISQEVLASLAPYTPSDGRAGVSLYFSEESQKMYYDGQFKPQRIFDAFAWAKFIEALKRGDFKKKKKK